MTSKILIMGLGNILMGDDALGPYAIGLLESRYEFPEKVALLDAGTPGLDLTPYLAGLDALLVIDTVNAEGAPGDVRCYRKEKILEKPPQIRLGPHDPGLKEALLTLDFAGAAPEQVWLVGVIPESVRAGVGLSEPVRHSLPRVLAAVREELARLGAPPREKSDPFEPDVWWER